jgi:DNA-binding CsgD family transcriptional regulator
MAIVKAEAVFNAGSGFSEEELARIMAAGAGRTVSFPRDGRGGRYMISGALATERDFTVWVLGGYAQGKTADQVAKDRGISRRQVFHLLKRARTTEPEGTTWLYEFANLGFSLRELGRLFGKSHEAVRQAAERLKVEKVEVTKETKAT